MPLKGVLVYSVIYIIMATVGGPRIPRNGLILHVDAGQKTSYSGTGEIWSDLSGLRNHATRTNNGGYGGQVSYNSSGYFDFSMNSPASTAGAYAGNGFTMSNMIIPSTGNFTLIAYIRRNTSVKAFGDRETIFSNTGDADGWRFGITGFGDIYYLIGGAGGSGYQEGSLGGTTLINGNWHMMAAVFDRAGVFGSYKIYGYIDGLTSGNVTISAGASGNVAFTTRSPGIGYVGCCDVFAGNVAIMSAYNKALTASEILQYYNTTKGRFGL